MSKKKRFTEQDLVDRGYKMEANGGFTRDPKIFGSLPEEKKKPKRKYRNNPCEYNGKKYDSEKEARYAQSLDLRKRSKDRGLIDWKGQVPISAVVNGIHICKYICDFVEEYEDGHFEYIDIKGFDARTEKFITTDVFKLKKKLIEAIHGIQIQIK